MGAGCSTSTPLVYDSTRVKPPSQSSTRLLNAFGEFSKVPSSGPLNNHQPPNHDSQGDLLKSHPPPPPSNSTSTHDILAHSTTTEILTQPEQPAPLQKSLPPCAQVDPPQPKSAQLSTTDICTPLINSPSQTKLPLQHSQSKKQQPEDDTEMTRSNSDETPSKPALVPPPENSRRRNSISVLPSFKPKPKVPGNVNSGAEAKKTDPDLVLWISNKLKTKLKLARISKAYDRYIHFQHCDKNYIIPHIAHIIIKGLSHPIFTQKWANKIFAKYVV